LPSSLTRVISITLVCSTCPPVSVLVRARTSCLEAFLGGMASGTRRPSGQLASHLTVTSSRIYLRALATCLPPRNRRRVPLAFLVPPSVVTDATWYGNINPLAIGYAFRPRLRSRLTLSRRALLRKPWTIGGGDSHPSFVTHAGILASQTSTADFRRRFTELGTLSYRARDPEGSRAPAASVTGLSPVTFSAPEHLTSELLRTLSRMAASKPTSWLSSRLDIVFHLAST
jgi:hypothetical protein